MASDEEKSPVRVLVADDQWVVRDGLSLLLSLLPSSSRPCSTDEYR